MQDPSSALECFYDGPLPRRARLAAAVGGTETLRRAEAAARSRSMDRLALGVVLRASAARRNSPGAAAARAGRDAEALARYRAAGLGWLARARTPGACRRLAP